MLFSCSCSRTAGHNDYEVEGLVEAYDAGQAAKVFFLDMLSVGWEPTSVAVLDGKSVRVFRIEKNILKEER